MDYTVAAVDEALSLLFLVAQYPGLGVTELSKRSGNTKARAFRLLTTLENRGLVQRDALATYTLGHKALHLGIAAQEQVNLVRLANEVLRNIGVKFDESVQLRVRDGLHSVCVARRESTQMLRVHGDVGNRRPLHAGAASKLLLAFSPDEIQQAVLASELRRFTPNTIVHRSKLAQELAKIRAQGYAVSFGEMTPDVVAVGAPVYDITGNVVAALSVSAPSGRVSKNELQAIIEIVVVSAGELSAALGYSKTSSLGNSRPKAEAETRNKVPSVAGSKTRSK